MANSALTDKVFRRIALPALCLFLLLPSGCFFWADPDMEQGSRVPQEQPQRGAEAGQRSARTTHPAEAEQAYARALSLWGRSSSGEACSDPGQAVALLDKAIALDPNYGEAYLRRGLARSEMGQFEEAFEDVTAGLRLTPTAEAYAYRGLVLLRDGQPKAARRDLEYSLSKDRTQHRALNYLGVLALSEDNPREACEAFSKACSRGDCFFLETARKEKICP